MFLLAAPRSKTKHIKPEAFRGTCQLKRYTPMLIRQDFGNESAFDMNVCVYVVSMGVGVCVCVKEPKNKMNFN